MAWGILMTFITLFGMMVLAMTEAMMSEGTSKTVSEDLVCETSAREKTDLPKAA